VAEAKRGVGFFFVRAHSYLYSFAREESLFSYERSSYELQLLS
jgi:hypothetical protein